MTQFRTLIGIVSLAVAMLALFGAAPLKAFSSTLQRVGLDWYGQQKNASASLATRSTTKTPVYFFSHGGPDVQYNTEHPVYPVLQKIGKEITQQVKPKAVVVFSAHWMGKEDTIHVNNAVDTDLIYDFYGFPDHFYKAEYPSKGDPELASKIMVMLSEAGIQSYGVKRGLDHGVWSGFHVAFNPETNPLNVPLVQVSLFKNEDPYAHYALGRAVASLRDQGIVIIGAGMSVHNLRDMHFMFEGKTEPLPYVVSFDNALRDAVESDPAVREDKMAPHARVYCCWRCRRGLGQEDVDIARRKLRLGAVSIRRGVFVIIVGLGIAESAAVGTRTISTMGGEAAISPGVCFYFDPS